MKTSTEPQDDAKPDSGGVTINAYLRPPEAAAYVGHSTSALAKLRMRQMREHGPIFIKRGGVVLYRGVVAKV
ncbi:MAG: hypothetical protein V2I51_20210 [Anderseniella sp.]|jgi:hypothetical protein|nr:hypothetical protein [Anderseniella sp.]